MKNKRLKMLIIGGLTLTLTTSDMFVIKGYGSNFNIPTNKNISKKSDNIVKAESTRARFLKFEQQTQMFLEQKKEEERRLAELEAERIRKEEEERIRAEEEARIAEINRKNSVRVNLDNVLEPSNITAEELYQVFIEMGKEEMGELAWAIVDAEYYTEINSIFLAALIAHESAYNTSYRAVYQNNVTGFAVYNSGAEGSNFIDKYSCIIQTAEWLKNEYLSPEGRYFNGYTTIGINVRYCLTEDGSQTDYNWATIINNIAKTIESYYYKYIL